MESKIMKTLALLIISCMFLPVFQMHTNAEKGDNIVLNCSDDVHTIILGVTPSNATVYEISVTNKGSSDDTIEMRLDNECGFLLTYFSSDKISLNASESNISYLTVVALSDVEPGSYSIGVTGISEHNNPVYGITVTVIVKEYFDIEMSAREKTIVVPVGGHAEASIEVKNIGEKEGCVNLSVSSDLPANITESVFLSKGESKNISLLVRPPFNLTVGNYPVNITAAFFNKNVSINITARVVKPAKILLVEKETSEIFRDAINNTFYYYDIANLSRLFLSDYDLVIWYCGKKWFDTISFSEQQELSNYLDNSGSLWLIGQDVLHETGLNDFAVNYLHVADCKQDVGVGGALKGVSGDPIGDKIDFPLTENWFADSLTPDNDSSGIFYGKNNYSAIRYSGVYQVAFFAFDFSCIQNKENRDEIASRVVAWFLEGEKMLACVNNVSMMAPGWSTDYIISVTNNYDYENAINFMVSVPLRWEASFNESITLGGKETKNVTLTVTCPPNAGMGDYVISFYGKSQNGVTDSVMLAARVSLPCSVLLVNDCESSFENILSSTFYYYDVFNVDSNGPDATLMEKYELVVWNTGKEWENTLTVPDQENISVYLENGGALWLIGQDILCDIYNSSFVKKYLHVYSAEQDAGIPNPMVGMSPVFPESVYATNSSSEDFGDSLMPDNDSFGIFYGKNNYSALAYSGVYRVVFFAFDFSFIQDESDKNEIAETVLGWLSEKKPDLAIGEIIVSVSNPKEGDRIVFSVNISNKGNQDAYDVNVLFTVDSIVVGEENICLLKSGEYKILGFEWKAVKGEHVVSAFVDPGNRIDESDETNSVANQMLSVEERKVEAWPSAPVIYAVMILCVFAIIVIILLRRKR
ncbi:MAG: CARDB domain-containing protein [Thermoplasmatales archaeon]|nr:CARDB domain-containing protein [Thermoplasmatales archaeon]